MDKFIPRIGAVAPKPPTPPCQQEITRRWQSSKGKSVVVSIICHCFNHEEFIEDALNGFLMQKTNFPWEVIVHDDASTDRSVDIIKEYAEQYPDIIKPIFQKENQFIKGIKPTFFTFKAAKGDFFAFCEGDDYWIDENKLQVQADFLRSNPDIAICGHDAFILEGDVIVKLSKLPENAKRDVSSKTLSRGWFILTLSAMYRNNFDLYPDEHSRVLNGDTFLFSRLGKIGGYKYISNLLPGAYRSHPNGIWSQLEEQKRLSHKLNSMFWISQYYRRIGDKKLSVYYAQNSALAALDGVKSMTLVELILFQLRLLKRMAKKLLCR